jgi:hypothetical protein
MKWSCSTFVPHQSDQLTVLMPLCCVRKADGTGKLGAVLCAQGTWLACWLKLWSACPAYSRPWLKPWYSKKKKKDTHTHRETERGDRERVASQTDLGGRGLDTWLGEGELWVAAAQAASLKIPLRGHRGAPSGNSFCQMLIHGV